MGKTTNLQRIRKATGLTQAGLAERSGVSVRLIQDYEQARKPINGAAGRTILKLSKALSVRMEDLMEVEK